MALAAEGVRARIYSCRKTFRLSRALAPATTSPMKYSMGDIATSVLRHPEALHARSAGRVEGPCVSSFSTSIQYLPKHSAIRIKDSSIYCSQKHVVNPASNVQHPTRHCSDRD